MSKSVSKSSLETIILMVLPSTRGAFKVHSKMGINYCQYDRQYESHDCDMLAHWNNSQMKRELCKMQDFGVLAALCNALKSLAV